MDNLIKEYETLITEARAELKRLGLNDELREERLAEKIRCYTRFVNDLNKL